MALNIAFLGSGGDFSLQPLEYLLASEHNLCLVGVGGISKTVNSDPRLQVLQPTPADSVESLARSHNIPLLDFQQKVSTICTQLNNYQLDLLIVGCYQHKLPEKILSIPKIATVNLHPSLLPTYRGPVPLFWQFRQGEKEFGITLHKMDANFDSGDIISQRSANFFDGISHQQANSILAAYGVQLLADYLLAIQNQSVREQKQAADLSTYMSYPQQADFKVSNNWSAQRTYNFICATRHWGRLYPCELNGNVFMIQDVIEYNQQSDTEFVDSHLSNKIENDVMLISCQPGILKVKLLNPIKSSAS